MPTRNTVADAPLDCMFLAFEGLQPRTRLWIRPLSRSLGDWLVFAATTRLVSLGRCETLLQCQASEVSYTSLRRAPVWASVSGAAENSSVILWREATIYARTPRVHYPATVT